MGQEVWEAIARVPRGGGVVLRHHGSDLALAERVAVLCRSNGLMLAVAGDNALAGRIGAAMVHNPDGDTAGLLISRSVHDLAEAESARGADLVFVSPIFATASHEAAVPIGIATGLALAKRAGVPAIALGGIDVERGDEAIRAGIHGWAAIGAWLTEGDGGRPYVH